MQKRRCICALKDYARPVNTFYVHAIGNAASQSETNSIPGLADLISIITGSYCQSNLHKANLLCQLGSAKCGSAACLEQQTPMLNTIAVLMLFSIGTKKNLFFHVLASPVYAQRRKNSGIFPIKICGSVKIALNHSSPGIQVQKHREVVSFQEGK